ncbi:MAG TPA: tetratricopeptide repeat protein [Syntrophobacteraceae bacterium]|nr:tetratricopeptide repeat protein [Syntrophobacteraceae bacterium]
MKNKWLFYLVALVLAAAVGIAYSNHFQNGFHFDDSHAIQDNINLRSIRNIPGFFVDATTFSALPANQCYRPVLSTLFALDYWAGAGSPYWFQVSAFFFYMILWVLLFLLFRNICSACSPDGANDMIALLASGFYVIHTANAETVNYISAGSDLLSTLLMVASLLTYAALPAWRRFGFYLIPAALAMLTKEVSAVFPLFLLAYVILIEKKIPLTALFKSENRKETLRALLAVLPAAVVCVGLLSLSSRMLPKTFTPSSLSRLEYLLAQPFALVHYFNSFLLPVNLSADTDWGPIGNLFDDRVLAGAAFIVLMASGALAASRNRRTIPIAFGILWFFIGCAPTSSGIVPLAEVVNHHRTFLPFIGLALAASWGIALLIEGRELFSRRSFTGRACLMVLIAALFAAHTYGTFQRNKVWKDEESLWHDVTLKSPGNARGLMNYGLALMARGDITGARSCFQKALAMSPDYAYLHINMAIAEGALGDEAAAESHFKRAIQCNPYFYGCYYYYARFLEERGRRAEAVPLLRKAMELSPGYCESRYLLMRIYARQNDWESLAKIAEDTLKRSPEDARARLYRQMALNRDDPVPEQEITAINDPTPENYVWLSLAYYQRDQFEKCIEAAQKALRLKPKCVEAYNNICSAYIRLGDKSRATRACQSALEIDAGFELARNNLRVAQEMK